MSRKIVGVTVGTPISPDSMRSKMKAVKSVNGISPDKNGNVAVEVGAGLDFEYDAEKEALVVVGSTGGGGGGADGVGIADITFKETTNAGNVYTVHLTNGDTYEIVAPKGDKGATGERGLQGIQGVQGVQGIQGEAGKTPVKGVDYFTAADKTELVNSVLGALPTWTGGSY